jgi:hypothetical protein
MAAEYIVAKYGRPNGLLNFLLAIMTATIIAAAWWWAIVWG